jgi:hypothetical protein
MDFHVEEVYFKSAAGISPSIGKPSADLQPVLLHLHLGEHYLDSVALRNSFSTSRRLNSKFSSWPSAPWQNWPPCNHRCISSYTGADLIFQG